MTAHEQMAAALMAEVDRLKSDNAYLRQENASLWESVHEAQDAVTELRSMVERAHT